VMIGNGRIVSRGSKNELLHAAGTVVRAADLARLERALGELGIAANMSEDGALRTDVEPPLVGKVALEAGVALTELRTADAGLEDMFLELTATSQRDGAAT
jgi:ABC-2 type transport system ATP-binding protein